MLTRRDWLRSGAAAGLGALGAPRLASANAVSLDRDWGGEPIPRSAARADLQRVLEMLVAKYRVPGAVVGVYQRGEVATAAAGTANLNTGARMTPDIGFLTGSITKVWTATLVMTFVDEGAIDLDRPLIAYLPNLRFGDPEATRIITVRHLLNHSSGLDAGDYILELGEGPAAHRLFVEALAHVGQIHRPGAYASYCNGGWVVAGHLLETLSGESWHALLTKRVIEPLGLTRTFPYAEDGVLHGVAVGSVPDPDRAGEHMATPKFLLPKSFAPAGATLITTVEDNIRFARMHMRDGVADDGTRVLSERSARAMATRTIDHPSGPASGFGLGWAHSTLNGQTRLSHGGGSNGGRAQLVAIPDADFAYASFVNSSASSGFQSELQQEVMSGLQSSSPSTMLGARPLATPGPAIDSDPVDRSRFTGTFRRMTSRTTIREERGKLILESEWILDEAEGTAAYVIGQPTVFEMTQISDNQLALASADPAGPRAAWTFLDPDAQGRFRLMYASGRLSRRIR